MERGEDLVRLRRLVAFDRVLARLFAGEGVPWLVKGGFGLEVRYRLRARTTRDLDLSVRRGEDPDGLRDALQAALERDVGDGFFARVGAAVQDLQGPPEAGVRFPVEVLLAGRLFASFHIDVGAGDPEVESPEWIVGEPLLNFAGIPAARMAVVPLAQQCAEKLHAYTRPRGRTPNTRVKDLVDLNLLMETGLSDHNGIAASVRATFASYSSHPIPAQLPEPPPDWSSPYEALAREIGLKAATLAAAHEAVVALWLQMVPQLLPPNE